jgi:hypothetical protein
VADNVNRTIVIMWTSILTVSQLFAYQYDPTPRKHNGQLFLIEVACNNVY